MKHFVATDMFGNDLWGDLRLSAMVYKIMCPAVTVHSADRTYEPKYNSTILMPFFISTTPKSSR